MRSLTTVNKKEKWYVKQFSFKYMVILLMVSFGVAKKYKCMKKCMKVCGFGNWYILRCQKTQDMIKS